ncbi:hypothetical protein POX_c04098 [Penicillium oxalicum]|uniref:hypothetical protein n=1 Tax=Penicillium oxalicum TaxID=69781 RepID=UPI0020B79C16|nr:hypothetical protein POX_c04098 [Penicillium oxalicum]KAI2791241.1 hypothetical protein POX_c04098 [Penicillium oxalicum]
MHHTCPIKGETRIHRGDQFRALEATRFIMSKQRLMQAMQKLSKTLISLQAHPPHRVPGHAKAPNLNKIKRDILALIERLDHVLRRRPGQTPFEHRLCQCTEHRRAVIVACLDYVLDMVDRPELLRECSMVLIIISNHVGAMRMMDVSDSVADGRDIRLRELWTVCGAESGYFSLCLMKYFCTPELNYLVPLMYLTDPLCGCLWCQRDGETV